MQSDRNYWTLLSRTKRRSFLRGASAFSAGVAGLALLGCGSSESKSSSGSSAKSLLTTPQDTTDKAVKGGVYTLSLGDDLQTFEPNRASDANQGEHAYSRLVKYQAFKYPATVLPAVAPDAALSWETSPDGLTYTYKLRPNMKFDPRPPTSGKLLTSADVLFSWNRFATVNPMRANLVNSVDATAPVTSVTAPDNMTVVFKLAFPYAPLNSMLAYSRHMPIFPTEAASGYNVKNDTRGTGAWRLKEYAPSVRIVHERNPDWYDADKVHFDGVQYFILPEYATGLSQLKAGTLATYGVTQEDVLQTKTDVPSLQMTPQEDFARSGNYLRFGYLPGSVFRDERVRRALSMQIDRDLYISTFGNVDKFTTAGLDAPTRWHTHVMAGEEGFWLDPQDQKTFGPSAKWFQHDVAEAKKMLQAAGFNGPVETTFTYTTDHYGTSFTKAGEVLAQMFQENGLFKLRIDTPPYDTFFRDKVHFNGDKHEGVAMGGAIAYPDIDGWLQGWLRSGSDRAGHLDANGQPDSTLDSLIAKQRTENDPLKRAQILFDLQRYAADKMYMMFEPGSALGFDLAAGWVGNWRVYRTGPSGVPSNEYFPMMWIDPSKKPA